MDADLAETVDMLTRAVGIIERELAKSAAWRSRKVRGESRIIDTVRNLLIVNAASLLGLHMRSR